MGERPKHQYKEFEALLREAERRGWRVAKPGGHFKAYCACELKHFVVVSSTPSTGRSLVQATKQFERCSCWR